MNISDCSQIHHLTGGVKTVYSTPTGAKSSVGATTSINYKAYSRFYENVAFFVPVIIWHDGSPCLWGLLGAEPAQVGEGRHLCGTWQHVDGCGNSFQCPPYSITTEMLGCNNSNTKVLIMPKSIFIVRTDVDPAQLISSLVTSADQIQALNHSMGVLLRDQKAIQNPDTFALAANVQWALASLIERHVLMAECIDALGRSDGLSTASTLKAGAQS